MSEFIFCLWQICSDGLTDSDLMVNFSHYNAISTLVIQQMVSLFLSWILWESGSYSVWWKQCWNSDTDHKHIYICAQKNGAFLPLPVNLSLSGLASCQWAEIVETDIPGDRQQFYCVIYYTFLDFLFSSKAEDNFLLLLFLSTIPASILAKLSHRR